MARRQGLLFEVRLLTDRYHGVGDWPPSPFRLFQALVAGAYGGRWRSEASSAKDAAFQWLERCEPPWMAAMPTRKGQSTMYYVPNNDIDARGGDARRAVRVGKVVAPRLLDNGGEPLLYAWAFDGDATHALTLVELANRLHTLGRGCDAAYAHARIVGWAEAQGRLLAHPGGALKPSLGRGEPGRDPTCPVSGSFASVVQRYEALTRRFEVVGRKTLFRQPPKAVSTTVSYGDEPTRLLFELCDVGGAFRPFPQAHVVELASVVREQIHSRLSRAMPHRDADIAAALAPRGAAPIRVVPLPSIGHPRASGSVRRILIEVPPNCSVGASDIEWSLVGQELTPLSRIDQDTGEALSTTLIAARDEQMLRHYGVGARARRYRTVTPIALENAPLRGRLSGEDRARQWTDAARQIADRVRAAGLPAGGLIVHAQREPFHLKGLRADAFRRASGDARTLVHAELIFQEPVSGPLVLGAGSDSALGLCRPCDPATPKPRSSVTTSSPVRSGPRGPSPAMVARFLLRNGPPVGLTLPVAQAVRAALMSKLGNAVPPEISGRDRSGPLRSRAEHGHAFFLPEDADGDGCVDHVLVYCANGHANTVKAAMNALTRIGLPTTSTEVGRGARAWSVALEVFATPDDLPASDLLGRSRTWRSVTPYLKARYDREAPSDASARAASYQEQVEREWRIRFPGASVPSVRLLDAPYADHVHLGSFVRTRAGRGGHQPDAQGAMLELSFSHPVRGPIALGKHAHLGMGLFARVGSSPRT